MAHKAVIGLGFGDEGKGHIVNYLISNPNSTLVVRFSGGQQAGHTVIHNGVRHVFSNFGSGTLKGAPSYFSKFCTIYPIGIINEQRLLIEKGCNPKLYIDPECPITTPYDVTYSQKNATYLNNGTCGVGVGATWGREAAKYSLLYQDLFTDWVFREKMKAIERWYSIEFTLQSDIMDKFYECCSLLRKSQNIIPINDNVMLLFDDIIFEGSQGIMLDQSFGIFPHVTRSNTGVKNIYELINYIDEVYYITRAYQTRHGIGPMSTEDIPYNIKINPLETNVTEEYQGEFRRGLLDISLLKYAKDKDNYSGKSNIVVTCMDHIVDEYRIVDNSQIIQCNNQGDFFNKIINKLNPHRLYSSFGDTDSHIYKT